MTKKQTRKRSELADNNVDGNVDKIREILFGGQMRDYEQRFADLEDRLNSHVEQISRDFEKRMERLDSFAKRELEKLGGQVKDERNERKESAKQEANELKGLAQKTESMHANLANLLEGETAELRELLKEQGSQLSGMLEESHEELRQSLLAETKGVADASVSKSDLAELFMQIGSRLKKESK